MGSSRIRTQNVCNKYKYSKTHEKEQRMVCEPDSVGVEIQTSPLSTSPDSICVETNVRWGQLRIRGCIGAYVLISGHAPTFLHLFLLPAFFSISHHLLLLIFLILPSN